MDVDFIFKVAAIGIIVTVLHQLLVRSGREDQAMLTSLAGLVIVLAVVVSISGIQTFAKQAKGEITGDAKAVEATK